MPRGLLLSSCEQEPSGGGVGGGEKAVASATSSEMRKKRIGETAVADRDECASSAVGKRLPRVHRLAAGVLPPGSPLVARTTRTNRCQRFKPSADRFYPP